MTGRTRASAKNAGRTTERAVADYMKVHGGPLGRFIDRARMRGTKDRGDIGNVETLNQQPVAVEVKDYGGRVEVGTWLNEADTERRNLPGAVAGVVIAKRRGTTNPGQYIVLMTVDDLMALLTGTRPNPTEGTQND